MSGYRDERIKARSDLIDLNQAEISRLIAAASADNLALAVTPWWRPLRRMLLRDRIANQTQLAGYLRLDNSKLILDNYLDAQIGRIGIAIDLVLDRMGGPGRAGKTNAVGALLQLIDAQHSGEREPS